MRWRTRRLNERVQVAPANPCNEGRLVIHAIHCNEACKARHAQLSYWALLCTSRYHYMSARDHIKAMIAATQTKKVHLRT